MPRWRRFSSRFLLTAGNGADGLNPGQTAPLAAPASIEQSDSGISLHEAASKGLEWTVLQRLGEGAPIDAQNDDAFTPLELAIREGHVGVVKLLMDRDADVEAQWGLLSSRPVHMVARTLNPEMMGTLLKYRPDLESSSHGFTALYYAVYAGDEEVVRLLLEAGANAKARTLHGEESILHTAVARCLHRMPGRFLPVHERTFWLFLFSSQDSNTGWKGD